MTRTFRLTYDYLCPFARIANEEVVAALRDGADWDVRFVPFALSETKVAEGERSVWDRAPGSPGTRGVLAHQWALAVREVEPDRFTDFHLALFAARHDDALDIDDESVLSKLGADVGVDIAAVADQVATGKAATILFEEHSEVVKRWSVFGVPTFIVGNEAVFVRFMKRSRSDVERVLDMLEWSNLNEFKRTTIPR